MSYTRALGAILIAAMLAACSGGGGNASFTPAGTTPPVSQNQRLGHIRAVLYVPPKKKHHQSRSTIAYLRAQIAKHWHSHAARKPKYLSGATTELDFTINTIAGVAATPADKTAFDFTIYTSDSSQCSGDDVNGYVCTVTASAPVGADTYQVAAQQCSVAGTGPGTTCASLDGTLSLLSASYASVSVVYDQTVTAAFTLSPVIGSIDWAPVTYANESGPASLPSNLVLTSPNGTNIPTYDPSTASYSCAYAADSRRSHDAQRPHDAMVPRGNPNATPTPAANNACYEPVAQGVPVSYGVVLEARDPNGALIVGASNGGTVYQTPVYLDASGAAVSINWSCKDQITGGTSLTWETGNGPYSSNANAVAANQSFNSPVTNPAADPDGGHTTDANGNPVTAVGNNGTEMNWDGVDQPNLNSPDYCTASTSNGLTTALDWYAGLGEGGITVPPPLNSTISVFDVLTPQEGPQGGQVFNYAPGVLAPPPTSVLTGLPNIGNTDFSGFAGSEPAMAYDSAGDLWISYTLATLPQSQTTCGQGYIVEYGPGASGSAAPLRVIAPTNATDAITGIAVDNANGIVYVGGIGCSSNVPQYSVINAYPMNANGSTAPIRTIGPASFMNNLHQYSPTDLLSIVGLTVDGSGNVWVLNQNSGNQTLIPLLLEFAPNASGQDAPSNTYMSSEWYSSCPGLQEYDPTGLTVDSSGNLIVAGVYQMMVFPAGFTASTCPHIFDTAHLAQGAPNGFGAAGQGVSVDNQGYIYEAVTQSVYGGVGNSGVAVYSETTTDGPNGFAPPAAFFTVGTRSVDNPSAVAVLPGSSGNLRHPHGKQNQRRH
jgi:hypothetical protein